VKVRQASRRGRPFRWVQTCLNLMIEITGRARAAYPLCPDNLAVVVVSRRVFKHVAPAFVEEIEGKGVGIGSDLQAWFCHPRRRIPRKSVVVRTRREKWGSGSPAETAYRRAPALFAAIGRQNAGHEKKRQGTPRTPLTPVDRIPAITILPPPPAGRLESLDTAPSQRAVRQVSRLRWHPLVNQPQRLVTACWCS